MKFSRRGMIKIRMPAIKATMAGTCAVVMTIVTPVMRGESLRGQHFIAARSERGDALAAVEFRCSQKLPENAAAGISCSGERCLAHSIGLRCDVQAKAQQSKACLPSMRRGAAHAV